MLTLILLLIFIPILLIVVFSLIAGAVGLVWGMFKFLLPVIIIAAVVSWLLNRNLHQSHHHYDGQQSYQHYQQSGHRARKELHNVQERDEHHDEWGDF